jgi:heme-degrading monooxygenase HmoA
MQEGSMFFRIARGKVTHGEWEAFEAAYRQAVHAAGKQHGLSGRWLMHDMADPDICYGMTEWDSLETLKAYEDGASKDILAAVRPFVTGEFTITYCEERYLWLAVEDYSGA